MSVWSRKLAVDELNSMHQGTLSEHLAISFTEVGPDYLRASMPVGARTWQPFGLLHGGASVVLAETLGSTGAYLCLAREDAYCVGLEINANHIRAVRSGTVTGTARPVHIGRSTQVWEIHVQDDRQRLIAVARITLAVLERQPGRGTATT